MSSIKIIHQQIVQKILPRALESSDVHAWWILEHVTGQKKEILLFSDFLITLDQQKEIDEIIYQFIFEQKPLQYLFKKIPFGDLELFVEPPILIPRHETEEWVFWLCGQLISYKNATLKILDIGTGSGCIALTLAKFLPNSEIVALDISEEALKLAQKNAHYNNIKNVTFLQSDLFSNIKNNIIFDVIVSNPPYISFNEYEFIDESVKKWEDPRALFCHDEGLETIKKIITQAPKYLKKNNKNFPALCIEIGHMQGRVVQEIMHNNNFKNVTIFKDMATKDRLVVGYL